MPPGGSGRVRSHRTFDQLRQSPARGRAGPVSVRFVAEKSWSEPQVAYAVGRRVGTAVVRNRVRRRLRAVVADLAGQLPPGAYLVSTGPDAVGMPFEELRKAMERALRGATGDRRDDPATGTGSSGR